MLLSLKKALMIKNQLLGECLRKLQLQVVTSVVLNILSRVSNLLAIDNIHWQSSTNNTNTCRPLQSGALFFYSQPTNQTSENTQHAMISSRRLVIGPLDPRNVTLEPHPSIVVPVTMPTAIPEPTDAESNILGTINNTPRLSEILALVNFMCVCAKHDL